MGSHTCWPRELHTQVLQSTELRVPGTQEEEEEEEEESVVQSAGQSPSLPGTCSPARSVLVEHQLTPSSTVVQLE